MKKKKKNDTPKENCNLKFLEELIETHYSKLKEQIENDEKLKIGDFIKMVELRNKLAPDSNSQKKLWDMLENIRKQTEVKNPNQLKKQKKTTSRKTKHK